MKRAVQEGEYEYYHLLSGADLPIKPMHCIHEFFDANAGKEFVRFQSEEFMFADRIRYYHFLQDKIGRNASPKLRKINGILMRAQKALHISNGKTKSISFQKGTQWFSITDELAKYVIEREKWIREVFRYSCCGDELFMQTLIVNSYFRERLYRREFDNDCRAIARLIDWNRGKPYVFRAEDFDELVNAPLMFARKFDEDIDAEIILRLGELYGI